MRWCRTNLGITLYSLRAVAVAGSAGDTAIRSRSDGQCVRRAYRYGGEPSQTSLEQCFLRMPGPGGPGFLRLCNVFDQMPVGGSCQCGPLDEMVPYEPGHNPPLTTCRGCRSAGGDTAIRSRSDGQCVCRACRYGGEPSQTSLEQCFLRMPGPGGPGFLRLCNVFDQMPVGGSCQCGPLDEMVPSSILCSKGSLKKVWRRFRGRRRSAIHVWDVLVPVGKGGVR